MQELIIQKIYRNSKVDSKGKPYQLINIYNPQKEAYTFFDYSGESDGWNEGGSLDISKYEQKENVYNGKTSIILSKPRKNKQEPNKLEERVAELEKRMDAVAQWAKSITQK